MQTFERAQCALFGHDWVYPKRSRVCCVCGKFGGGPAMAAVIDATEKGGKS